MSDDVTPTDSPAGSTTGTATPVSLGRLSGQPDAISQRRVLGVVPGKPIAGDRKEPADDDMVMVWPHLLVRHAVAALATMLTVLVISVLFDAPLRDHAEPDGHPESREGALVLRGPAGTPGPVPSAGRRGPRSGRDPRRVDRPPLHRPQPLRPHRASPGRRRHVHHLPRDLDPPHHRRLRLPGPELGLGLAVAGMARGAVMRRPRTPSRSPRKASE